MVDKEYPFVVKFYKTEDGDEETNKKWCLVIQILGSPAALCSGQVYGYGEGALDNENGLDYKDKWGKVTCEECRDHIKTMKNIKL